MICCVCAWDLVSGSLNSSSCRKSLTHFFSLLIFIDYSSLICELSYVGRREMEWKKIRWRNNGKRQKPIENDLFICCQEIENFHNFSLHSFVSFFYMRMKVAVISIWANFAATLRFYCAMPEKFQWQPAVCIWINDRIAIWTRMLRLNSSNIHSWHSFCPFYFRAKRIHTAAVTAAVAMAAKTMENSSLLNKCTDLFILLSTLCWSR